MVEHKLCRKVARCLITIELPKGFFQTVVAGFAFDNRQRQAINKQQQVRAKNIAIGIAAYVLIDHVKIVIRSIARIEEAHTAHLALQVFDLNIRAMHHLLPERLIGLQQIAQHPLAQLDQHRG